MTDAAHHDYLILQSWTGPRTQGLGELLRDHGSVSAVLGLDETEFAPLPKATQATLASAKSHWPRPGPHALDRREMRDSQESGNQFIPITDRRYPQRLLEIPDPPPWLFARGELASLEKPMVSIVGSRRASLHGESLAQSLGAWLASAGYAVVSGLALGIDGAAHRGALKEGTTIAVLANGLDHVYPPRHRKLATEVCKRGCLLSEYPAGTPPSKHAFPRRNRIISGLSEGTIIVEAGLPSGTLHTAHSALEQGRDIFVLPWSLRHANGAGCLRLLRDGATPITNLDDLKQFFPPLTDSPSHSTEGQTLREDIPLLKRLGDGMHTVEELQAALGMPLPELLTSLAELEIAGMVVQQDGRYGTGA
ncbi:MAG: DNA-processing protein DprA [Pseudomonadota bacterium]